MTVASGGNGHTPYLRSQRIRSSPSSPEALLRTGSTWSLLLRRPAHLKIKIKRHECGFLLQSLELNFGKGREEEKPTVQAAERPGPVVPDEPGEQVGGEEDEPVRVPRPQRLPPPGLVRAAAAVHARPRASCRRLGHGHTHPFAALHGRSASSLSSAARFGAGFCERGRLGSAPCRGRRTPTPQCRAKFGARKGEGSEDESSRSRARRCSEEAGARRSTAVRSRCSLHLQSRSASPFAVRLL